MGQVEAIVEGQAGHLICLFGDEEEQARIGSHGLDSLLLQLDSEGTRLMPKEFHLIQHF